jgi:hypothetical protein
VLDEKKFDDFAEGLCERFYAEAMGRPGLGPGIYFRLLMVAYFEGVDSERGIAGAPATVSRSGPLCESRWMRRFQTIRPSRGRGG